MNAYLYQRILLGVRVFLICLFAGVLWFLLSRDLVLSGRITYETDLLTPSPFFSQIVPLDRTQVTDNGLDLVDEPAYLSLFYPRPFHDVEVEVEFSNPDLLFVEMGPLAGQPEYYDRQALYHPQLEQLAVSENWGHEAQDLFQRKGADYVYASAQQLFDQPAAQQEVGYYGLDWPTPYLPTFQGVQKPASIDYPLRGAHKTLVALNSDQLTVGLTVSSFHELAGDDDVHVRLRDWQGSLLSEKIITQPEKGLGVTGNKLSEEFVFTGLAYPAVYRIDLETTDDVVIHELSVNSPYMVFDGSVRLAGGPSYQKAYGSLDLSGASLVSGARSWHAQTDTFDSLQSLRLADATVTLTKPLEAVRFAPAKSFRFLLDKGYLIYLQKGDLLIQGKGVFAQNQSSYFNPYPWFVDGALDPDLLGVDYVVSAYRPVERDGGILRQRVSVDLTKVFAPNKQLRMQIAIPRLIDGQRITLRKITADFSTEPVTWSNAKEKLSRFLKREILR